MKRKLFLSILIVFFTTSFISIGECNNQTSTTKQSSVLEKKIKEDYGLQERCGNKSEEYFKKEHGNGVYEDEQMFHHNISG